MQIRGIFKKEYIRKEEPQCTKGWNGNPGIRQIREELRSVNDIGEKKICGKSQDGCDRTKKYAPDARNERKKHRVWDKHEREEIRRQRIDGKLAVLIQKKRKDRDLRANR